MRAMKRAGLSLVLSMAWAGGVWAQDTAEPVADEWSNTVLTYLWVVGVKGDAEVGLLQSDVDINFDDILEQLSAGVSLIYEGYNRDWMVLLDGTYLMLESDDPIGGAPAEAKESFALLEGGIGHRITKAAFPKVMIGFRYIGARVEIDTETSSADSGTKHILDPLIGLYHKVDLTDQWGIRALIDIGGFGVGTELSYGGGIGTYYKFKNNWGTELGYRLLDIDFDGDSIEFDGVMHGAYVGVSKKF